MALSEEDSLLEYTSAVVAITQYTLAFQVFKQKQKKKKKRLWVRPWVERKDKSVGINLLKELSIKDRHGFYDYHQMSVENFTELLALVAPIIMKQDTKLRKAIPPDQRLSVTLFYLATGHSRRSLEWSYRISHNLISAIIPEVCKAIYVVLKDSYLKMPTTTDEWHEVAFGFNKFWNFPLCFGALDGKRVLMKKPPNSGSENFDCKIHHSVLMLALVDADYHFLFVDVGEKGHDSDAGFWDTCTLRECIEKEQLQIPPAAALPYTNTISPYVIVGDDAFPLKTYLMKPYPGRNITKEQSTFNYRLSRARRVSENAFGLLSSKFRVFVQPIASKPEYVKDIIFATVVLHNFLQVKSGNPVSPEMLQREDYTKGIVIRGEWESVPNVMENLPIIARCHSDEAENVRDTFKDYFMNRGAVPWQEIMSDLY